VNRNSFAIGVLVAVLIGLGGYLYYEQTRPKALELRIGEGGVTLQKN
jgi:hypothetical protein